MKGGLTMNHPTDFLESNVLLAVIDDNTGAAEEILAGMTDIQIKYLHKAAMKTAQLCDRILYERERGEQPPWAGA